MSRSQRAFESISAHYQGFADLYTAQEEKEESLQALGILSERYQRRADLYAE
jgi:DNA-directed RNA polymerase subunit N (RpoN/RPB10)